MEAELWASLTLLRDVQYRTDDNLAARQSIYGYERPRTNLPASVLALLDLRGDEVIADVGCGNGAYLAELARRGHRGLAAGLDQSYGMLMAARERTRTARLGAAGDPAPPRRGRALAAGDAAALPLRDGACDVVLGMHMLYHVPGPRRALAEFRRVARPGGRVVIALNGEDHLLQIREAVATALRELGRAVLDGLGLWPDQAVRERVGLDEGEALAGEVFAEVARHEFAGELAIPGSAPVEAYVRSMMAIQRTPDPQRVAARAASLIPAGDDGTIRVTTRSGCLICR